MTKNDIINKLVDFYSNGDNGKFAKKLGIAPTTLSSWKARNTIDYDLLFAKCEGINTEWLLSGVGPMVVSENFDISANYEEDESISETYTKDGVRLEEIAGDLSLKLASLAKLLKADSPAQWIYDVTRGKSGISKDVAKRIVELFPEYNIAWVCFGYGDKFNNDNLQEKGATFKDRLIEFLAYLKIGQGAFEAKTGISNGSISKIKDGMSTASIDKIMTVYPNLNIEWLISGTGEMIKVKESYVAYEDKERVMNNSWFIEAVQKLRGMGHLKGDGVISLSQRLNFNKTDISLFLNNKKAVSKPFTKMFNDEYGELLKASGTKEEALSPTEPEDKFARIEASLRTNEILLQSLHEEIYVMQRFQVWIAINTCKIQDSEVFDKLDSIRNDLERSKKY